MSAVRPDPDALLARVQGEEGKARRGKLKVFFGAPAGVGKTYAMLEDARALKARGVDVVVGYVEPHGRDETEALLEGRERLPYRQVAHRGAGLRAFDLDAALARRPRTLLVDELAHSNPLEGEPRPRHAKRWQDVEELLEAGIAVHTTVNVQHVESLNDIVAGITGVRMQETVPDSVFERADEVVMIDTPPDVLLERLQAGKVYIPEQARNAVENFFRKGNLIALREVALRTTADRVDAAMREYREGQGIRATWAAGERLLVAIGPDEQGERLVRAGKRMATALHAGWIVVYVETPELLRLSDEKRNRRIALLRLAESLGAEAVTLGGSSAGEEIANYARERNVTRIVIGRPRRPLWRRLFRPSTYGELVAGTEGIDILVVGGADEASVLRNPFFARSRAYMDLGSRKLRWPGYAVGLAAVALCTAIGTLMSPMFELVNIAMVYLLAVVLIALRFGRCPACKRSVRKPGGGAVSRRRGAHSPPARREHAGLAARRGPRCRAMGAGPRRARWPRHRHAAFRRIGIPALERLASGARRAGRASRERSAGAPARAVPPARDLRRPDRDRARARAPRRAGAARPGRRRDRGPEECPARLDLARPAHAAGGDLRGLVEPGGARRAPRRRGAQGAGGEHLRAIAADGRPGRQRARDDAARGGRDRAQPRLAQHERNCRRGAAPAAGPPGVAPGRGRPADGAAAGARRRRAPRAGARQPDRESGQAHAARNAHHAARRQAGRRPAGFRRGRRARIAGRGSRAAVRQVPSRQYRGHRRRGRAGSRHLPRHRAPARRAHLGGDARRRRRRGA